MRTAIMTFGVALAMALVVVPASALTIETDANYEVLHDFLGPQSDSDGPNTASSGSVQSVVSFGGFGLETTSSGEGPSPVEEEITSFGDANAFAEESGRLAASGFLFSQGDVSSMDFHSTTSWSDVFTNTTGGNAIFDFDFNFTGGRLELDGDGGMAMFSLDILLDGSSIWNRTASLTRDPFLGTNVLDAGGLDNLVFGSGNYTAAFFDPFSGNLNLGSFGNGDSFELTYVIETWVSTNGKFAYGGAAVGDPFGGGFSGTLNAPTNAPVPEPTTMALLGMGIAGLGARRLRKKN